MCIHLSKYVDIYINISTYLEILYILLNLGSACSFYHL